MAIHGGDIYTAEEELKDSNIMDFSANINPFGIPDAVYKAVIENIDSIVNYPDTHNRRLRRAISRFHDIPFENIVCGNGGADVIFRTVKAVSPSHALIPVPVFSEYEDALKESGCEITYFHMKYPFQIDECIFEEITKNKYDFLVLCNPNNPTGAMIEPCLLREILKKCEEKNIFVLLDECFYDMSMEKKSVIDEYDLYSGLLILKSFTKMYSIPGIRLGYGVSADKQLIEKIRCTGQAWPVNNFAEAIGDAVIESKEYCEKFLEFLNEEKMYIYNELKSLGFEVWYPNANYVFFHSSDIKNLEKKILKYSIIMRNCDTYTGLEKGYYRVAVKKHHENQYLIECLKKIVKENGEK